MEASFSRSSSSDFRTNNCFTRCDRSSKESLSR
jgi:hypothetical protein